MRCNNVVRATSEVSAKLGVEVDEDSSGHTELTNSRLLHWFHDLCAGFQLAVFEEQRLRGVAFPRRIGPDR